MQRMTDVLSRMLNDPATRAALSGGGEDSLEGAIEQQEGIQNADGVNTDANAERSNESAEMGTEQSDTNPGTSGNGNANGARATSRFPIAPILICNNDVIDRRCSMNLSVVCFRERKIAD